MIGYASVLGLSGCAGCDCAKCTANCGMAGGTFKAPVFQTQGGPASDFAPGGRWPTGGTQPQQAPRDPAPWEIALGVARQIVPTVVEKVPDAHRAYEVSGGGVRGAIATIEQFGVPVTVTTDGPIRGIPARAHVASPKLASEVEQDETMHGGLSLKTVLAAGAAAVAGWWLWRRKK